MKELVNPAVSCFTLWCLVASVQYTNAQTQSINSAFADLTVGVGATEGTAALSYTHDWGTGKQKKFILGFGGRFTSYLGKNRYYVTAPAEITSGSTGPFVIFKENIEANMDTFLVQTAQVNALNVMVTLGYKVSDRLQLRFNIDVVGFSFGKSKTGNYINGSQGAFVPARPSAFNLLLVSDNDLGSLNSELIARYIVNDKWGLKTGFQFLFTEYTTTEEVQQYPEPNDRFRKKSLMFCAGITYNLTPHI